MTERTPDASRYWAVIPAAGRGQRMGETMPKQYLPLRGTTVLRRAMAPFEAEARVKGIVLVVAPDDPYGDEYVPVCEKLLVVAHGGKERFQSVLNGLKALVGVAEEDDWVLVHDAARPCLHIDDLVRLIEEVGDDPVGGLLAVPVQDTLKRAADDGSVERTLDRRGLWRALTPQMFRFGLLRAALSRAVEAGHAVTDEASAVEEAGFSPRLVEGRGDNLKITRGADLDLAERVLTGREW